MREVDGLGTGLFVLAALLLVGASRTGVNERSGVAFFYAHHPSPQALRRFRAVVVEPSAIDRTTLDALRSSGVVVHAYLSVGEVETRSDSRGDATGDATDLPASVVLGRNEAWGTLIVDPAADAWRDRLLTRARALRASGYDGLFLDTLDSFRGVVTEPAEVERRWTALAGIVRALHDELAGVRLLLNRGFEILPDVASLVDGVAGESLFHRWDPSHRRYEAVPVEDRRWLAARLTEARDRYGLEAIAIDYVPADDPALARRTALAITALGLLPYVAQPAFDRVGEGPAREPAPRTRRKRHAR